ncbi:MAG: hypothetical protein JXA30_17170 [Deltaproteobacteria bacterium]|nr:hypothetical protein [Deltaproteobacteria bacterium]
MPRKRREPTESQRKKHAYNLVEQRAELFINRIGDELESERKSRGGVIQLENAIAEACGGFPFLERRKLTRLIAKSRSEKSLMLTALEMAALDLFWKEKGGFTARLRPQTLAESLSRTNRVIIFFPSLPWDKQDDPEKLGFVPVADVRAATILRQALLGLNPSVQVQVEEVPSGKEEQPITSAADLLRNIPEARGVSVNVVSIGSPRTNRLSKTLLDRFFGSAEKCPFEFCLDESGRHLSVTTNGERRNLADHAVICVCHTKGPESALEVVVAGDRSLSTIGAAREIVNFRDDTVLGTVAWALVQITSDSTRSKVATSHILSGYPVMHPL